MNPGQNKAYWAEWEACSDALKKLGHAGDDYQRKAFQADAIGGVTKSSAALTNAELTKVLAKFRSYSKPADFAAQMHAQTEPAARHAAIIAEIERLADATEIKGGIDGVSTYFKRWLDGRAVEKLDPKKLNSLRFILRKRAAEMGKTVAPASIKAPSGRRHAVAAVGGGASRDRARRVRTNGKTRTRRTFRMSGAPGGG